ncbi:RNase H domain-containing protein [Trichonephila clavipes]|nr:RNase H domain-containing protein [Trichonephila clavipes]
MSTRLQMHLNFLGNLLSKLLDYAFLIYTDGSRNEHSRSRSGIYIKSQNYSSHTKLRNSDGCSVFHNELIAIDAGLKETLSIPGSNSIWILSDSRSAIQHLSNWHKVGDNTGVAILDKLKHISSSREMHLQWVLLYVNIAGNEIADTLVKDGAAQPSMNLAPLTYSELHSTYITNKQANVPPAHHWYEAKRPCGSLSLQCSRQQQTILTRFRRGHLRTLTFKDGNKVFPTCVRCSPCQASPAHILYSLGLSKQDLYEDPLRCWTF